MSYDAPRCASCGFHGCPEAIGDKRYCLNCAPTVFRRQLSQLQERVADAERERDEATAAWAAVNTSLMLAAATIRDLESRLAAPAQTTTTTVTALSQPKSQVEGRAGRPTCDVTGCTKGPGHYHEKDGKTYYYPKTWEPDAPPLTETNHE